MCFGEQVFLVFLNVLDSYFKPWQKTVTNTCAVKELIFYRITSFVPAINEIPQRYCFWILKTPFYLRAVLSSWTI